ncbi:MAG: glycosyltransferase [Saprospiraceae bacterium]|nr:glycosyltransferase [Saprospiraceae bacterium]
MQAEVPSINMRFPEYVHLNNTYQVFELVDDLSPTTLVTAIEQLLHDTEHYQQLVANCQKARQQWTWQHEEKRLVAFMQRLFNDFE